ncbi:unnamed protein product, partial [Mesorhabditis belari]|uniref:Uncharacterized protein n=1 Tax=Mesorhabditis belari TaxID=2138241 RepID=A0AAF3FL90_9BILA
MLHESSCDRLENQRTEVQRESVSFEFPDCAPGFVEHKSTHPPLVDESSQYLPVEWINLPSLAIPDGAHHAESDLQVLDCILDFISHVNILTKTVETVNGTQFNKYTIQHLEILKGGLELPSVVLVPMGPCGLELEDLVCQLLEGLIEPLLGKLLVVLPGLDALGGLTGGLGGVGGLTGGLGGLTGVVGGLTNGLGLGDLLGGL